MDNGDTFDCCVALLNERRVNEGTKIKSKGRLADNYFHAVQEAVKSVADKMRTCTGLTDDGAALVDRALSGEPPLLAINPRSTASEKSEQSGFANLVRGTFGMFRNPTAHEARIHWAMSKEDAEDLLTMVSLIHRRLDRAHMPPRV